MRSESVCQLGGLHSSEGLPGAEGANSKGLVPMAGKPVLVTGRNVLVCSHCHNKVPQVGLKQQRCVVSVLEAESLRSRY